MLYITQCAGRYAIEINNRQTCSYRSPVPAAGHSEWVTLPLASQLPPPHPFHRATVDTLHPLEGRNRLGLSLRTWCSVVRVIELGVVWSGLSLSLV